jgi:predicted phosphodiesterase
MSQKYTTFCAVGDNHGHLVDKHAQESLEVFLRKNPCEHRIHLGDLNDFGGWRTGASKADQEEGTQADLKAGREFLRILRPTVFHYGNHDKRALEQMESRIGDTAEAAERAVRNVLDSLQAVDCREIYSYKVIGPNKTDVNLHRQGKLVTTHGFFAGTNATRNTAAKLGRPGDVVIHGHTHDFNQVTIEHLEAPIVGISAMCMMNIDLADYALTRPATTRWTNGWCYGVIEERTGLCKVWTAHKFDGQFVITNGFELI